MPNRKLIPQALSLACVALTWAAASSAENSPAAVDGGNLPILAVAGAVLLLVVVLVWRSLASRRTKKPDPAGFMTLEQITRLESPGDGATLMKVAQPKPMPSQTPEKSSGAKQPASSSDDYMSELEKQYPRIAEKLVTMWNAPESEAYLQGLSFDERGDREGFGREVAAEIMVLYGLKVKARDNIWH